MIQDFGMIGKRWLPAVKICGIRSVETLRAMRTLPVDYVGFVFAKSKRQVTPEEAGQMIAFLRECDSGLACGLFRTVGVFVDPDPEMLAKTLRQAPLDVVQLHGRETAEFCRWVRKTFGVEVWKSVSVAASGDRDQTSVDLDAYRDAVAAILLDTAGGGTGQTFDWRSIPAYADWCRKHGIRLFVAGGLHPGNVGELFAGYRPDGVDVSSGVETEGVKDPEKIIRFVERVKRQ